MGLSCRRMPCLAVSKLWRARAQSPKHTVTAGPPESRYSPRCDECQLLDPEVLHVRLCLLPSSMATTIVPLAANHTVLEHLVSTLRNPRNQSDQSVGPITRFRCTSAESKYILLIPTAAASVPRNRYRRFRRAGLPPLCKVHAILAQLAQLRQAPVLNLEEGFGLGLAVVTLSYIIVYVVAKL